MCWGGVPVFQVPCEQLLLGNAVFYRVAGFRGVRNLRVSEQVAKLTGMFHSSLGFKVILEGSFYGRHRNIEAF